MVMTQRSSQGGASAKKQQSISNFFTKKSPPSKPQPALLPSSPVASTSSGTGQLAKEESLFINSEEDEEDKSFAAPQSSNPKHALEYGEEEEEEPHVRLPARKKLRRSNQDNSSEEVSSQDSNVNGTSKSATRTLSPIPSDGIRVSQGAGVTSRYVFSSSPPPHEDNAPVAEETRKRKELLHQKFVKKLGRPGSIAEIKRRNWQLAEETPDTHLDTEEVDDAEEEEGPKSSAKGKKGVAAQKSRGKLTPLLKQFLEIKHEHMDAILVVEVGYKFKFFGEDARTAAKELGIVCIPGKFRYDEHISEAHLDNFASASFPVHRLHVHVKRLVNAGHKVGIVRQLETAALKAAGDNRNTPFVRRLTNLYTKGTYVDDVEGLTGPSGSESPSSSVPATGYLLCITESNAKGWGTDEKVNAGILAVQPATGDVIYDDFEDGFMRTEIETRLLHVAPCEILIVGNLSKSTEKLVQHLSGSKNNIFGDKVRLERIERSKTMAAQAYTHVSNFYAGKLKVSNHTNDEKAIKVLEDVLKLSENVTICLSAMITHMTDYGLEHVFDLAKYFQSFGARSHMVLNGTSLTSLEIYQNQTDHSEKGSLFWTLDRTKTRFGQRLLRKWVGRPLVIKSQLEDRIAAVEELKSGEPTIKVDKVKRVLSQIKSDLERSLIRIYYGKCTRPELLVLLQTLQRTANEFADVKSPENAGFKSTMISNAIAAIPPIAADVNNYLDQINLQAARDDDKFSYFRDEMESEQITEHKLGIASVEHDLDAHRAVAAEKIRKKKVDYVVVAGIEYLIEVDNSQLKHIPASWAKISGTKKLSRFHTPEVVRLIRERDQHKEALAAACDVAFSALLNQIAAQYQSFRDCIYAIASLDCLLSLAIVANQTGYVKPEYTDSTCIAVEQGRHPMVEQILLDAYVPNDTWLSTHETRALLITGPNMGGKSSYVRQVALIAIMGQIGSYVPAQSAKLGMLDGVFTRMGAYDNMMAGESTFMVELSETSDILKQATSRSLIILDELGRGTSTHDGIAIAQAVLDHVVRQTKCLTLFITHYQNLSSLAKGFDNQELKNVHMRFKDGGGDGNEITFLYEVGDGVAHRSYGLNVARLAGVPDSILQLAAVKSKKLEETAREKGISNLSRSLRSLLENPRTDQLDYITNGIEQL